MTTDVLQASRFHLAAYRIQGHNPMKPEPSPTQPNSSRVSSPPPVPEKTLKRLRSSLEQSIRSATRSRSTKVSSIDETGKSKKHFSKKETATIEPVVKDVKSKSKILKVPFLKSGRDIPSPLPPAPGDSQITHKNSENATGRQTGFTSFLSPSLRHASISSPALHLYSESIPTPYTQAPGLVSSSSNIAGPVSPPRDRKKPSTPSGDGFKDISTPSPLSPRSDSNNMSREASRGPTSRKHRQPVPTSSSSPSPSKPSFELERTKNASAPPQSPTHQQRDRYHVPESPTPHSRGNLPEGTASTSQSTLSRPSPSSRTGSPIRARSPSNRQPPPSPSSANFVSSSPDNVRRRSLDYHKPRGLSVDIHKSTGPPSPTVRSRAASPSSRSFSPVQPLSLHPNISTTSLSSHANSEHRELIRNATSMLCKELLKPPVHKTTGLGIMELEEIEVRMRALARMERIWGKSGCVASSSNLMISASGGLSSSGLSAAGEEREKRLFSEALRDGYVLCQLANKVRPGSITRVDKREDGMLRASNVSKFLASCSTLGLPPSDLFLKDDIMEASFESLARVARTIICVIQFAENSSPNRSKYMYGRSSQDAGPYSQDTGTRGTASTPNLILSHTRQRSGSPAGPSSPISISGQKRPSPTADSYLAYYNDVLESGNDSDGRTAQKNSVDPEETYISPPPPPPRSRLRPKLTAERPLADTRTSTMEPRQSVASSNITDMTTYSSLLEPQRYSQHKFGTIRTVTTEATSFMASDTPSFTRTEASSILEEGRKWSGSDFNIKQRDRKSSGSAVVDLSRVAEETEESGTSLRGKWGNSDDKSGGQEGVQPKAPKIPAIRLGKGKWPDDFFDALPPQKSNQSVLPDVEESFPLSESPKCLSPSAAPRKLAIVGRGDTSADFLLQLPRKPSHRGRHSVDNPGLLPKENMFRRDSSPDDRALTRAVLRKNSGPLRNGVHLPRSSLDGNRPSLDNGSQVPFPRTVSGDHSPSISPKTPTEQPVDFSDRQRNGRADKPHQPRGRFQSEVDGASSRRRPRPSSYDELGNNPRRSRFESMMNLGAGSGSASASDLLLRTSQEDHSVRQTLIIREDGKAATQFQLGNCIGRGQFGAVYRALNLNTGQMVAVKRISLSGLKEEEISQLMKEVDLMKSLSHPGIVKYEGMARDQDTLSIVLEYAENGSLGQTLKAFGKLNERLIASYVVKILEGLHYLHRSEVVHCDLKAANILTTKTGNVKLSDFGVSLNLRAMEREMKDVAGTPNWMAPEVIELKGASPKSDIWSLACTIIELLTGRPPYAEVANGLSVMFRIVEDAMPPLPEGISELLADFLKQCFNRDPTRRPDADILCEHQWLKQNWGLHKELRPQDSIPFLRRVSVELQKPSAAEVVRPFNIAESARSETPAREEFNHAEKPPASAPLSNNDVESISGEHEFVKTMFAKPVKCRVCYLTVRRNAVICSQCSLIAHSKCATNAPPTCSLRAQLLLYAQYADNSTPPMDILGQISTTPTSDGGHTSRTSLDTATAQTNPSRAPTPQHPPTAFNIKSPFQRSRRPSLLQEPPSSTSTASFQVPPPPIREKKISKKASILKRSARTLSMSSNSTSPVPSSLRSDTTVTAAAESVLSEDDERTNERSSRMTGYSMVSEVGEPYVEGIPEGTSSRTLLKTRDSKSSQGSGCVVQ